MKKIEEIKLKEIEALSDFQDHIGLLLSDIDDFRVFVDKKEQKQLQRCYEYLDSLWERIEKVICDICDADERKNKLISKK